jgi:replicative DNA helicase
MAVNDERITTSLQENLITLLCYDDKQGKIIANLAEPELFEGDYREICERALVHWKRHREAPKGHTADLFSDILDDKQNRRAGTYRRILRSMAILKEEVNTDYVMNQLLQFSRLQRMKDAIFNAAEKLQNQKELAIQEVEEMLADMLRSRNVGFQAGLRLSEVDRVIEFLRNHATEFATGIKALDDKHIVPARGGVFLWLAPTGRGKTWAMVSQGKQAIIRRKKVLHVSLEISEEEVAQRYYQALFSIPKHDAEVVTARMIYDNEGNFEDIKHGVIRPKYSFDSETIGKRLTKEMRMWQRRLDTHLIIKRFPGRSLSMNGLRAYLDNLETSLNFIPDIVILDYIGITAVDTRDVRVSLGRALEDFRAIMVERNMAGVTAHQVSKEGAEANVVKATHVAEDWSLIHTADIAVTYSCTSMEERLGLARLFVAKARSEADKFSLILTQAYALGQFFLESAPLRKMYYQTLNDWREEEGDDGDPIAGARPLTESPKMKARRRP